MKPVYDCSIVINLGKTASTKSDCNIYIDNVCCPILDRSVSEFKYLIFFKEIIRFILYVIDNSYDFVFQSFIIIPDSLCCAIDKTWLGCKIEISFFIRIQFFDKRNSFFVFFSHYSHLLRRRGLDLALTVTAASFRT